MQVHGDVEVLADGPEPVVLGVVERLHPLHVRRHGREQHAAAEPVLLDPGRVLDGVVDVVEEDLPDAGAPLGPAVAEVDHPAVVGLEAGPAALVVLLGFGGPAKRMKPG